MRELPKTAWLSVSKRQWSKPAVEQVTPTPEVLDLLRRKYGPSPALDRIVAAAKTGR